MQGKIRFSYDIENDIVVATTLRVDLETEEDVVEWYGIYAKYLRRFGRKMDLIVDLTDGFSIKPSIGKVFGQYRVKIHDEFSRWSYRVNPNSLTRLFVQTSAIAGEAIQTADCFSSVEAAKKAILAHRQSGTEPSRPPVAKADGGTPGK